MTDRRVVGRGELSRNRRARAVRYSPHFLVFVALAFAAAFALCSPAGAGVQKNIRDYTLAAGDRIVVTVFGQPEASADVLVDDSGAVALPLIGSVDVKDLTIAECQDMIRNRFADGFFHEPLVTVRLSEPRPLYIFGDVRTPGAYPFRYGATVITAIALAGGFGPAEPLQIVANSDYLVAAERVKQLRFHQRALLIRQARIEAQSEGKDTFAPPPLPEFADASDVSGLVATEKATLASQTATLKEQLSLLRSQKPRLEHEIEAINKEIETTRSQLQVVKQELDQSDQLLKKGLGLRTTEVNLKIEEASEEGSIWRLAAQVYRLEMDAGELDIKVQEVEASYSEQLSKDLEDVRDRLAELDVTLPSAREMLAVKAQQAGILAGIEAARSISITRTRNGEAKLFHATETTPLEPGDVINVIRSLPEGVLPQSPQVPPSG